MIIIGLDWPIETAVRRFRADSNALVLMHRNQRRQRLTLRVAMAPTLPFQPPHPRGIAGMSIRHFQSLHVHSLRVPLRSSCLDSRLILAEGARLGTGGEKVKSHCSFRRRRSDNERRREVKFLWRTGKTPSFRKASNFNLFSLCDPLMHFTASWRTGAAASFKHSSRPCRQTKRSCTRPPHSPNNY